MLSVVDSKQKYLLKPTVFSKRFDGDSLFCYTDVRQPLFFGHVGTANPKTLSKQELFANFSGNKTETHNPKDSGPSPTKKGTQKCLFSFDIPALLNNSFCVEILLSFFNK
jgi:hypothetical protein